MRAEHKRVWSGYLIAVPNTHFYTEHHSKWFVCVEERERSEEERGMHEAKADKKGSFILLPWGQWKNLHICESNLVTRIEKGTRELVLNTRKFSRNFSKQKVWEIPIQSYWAQAKHFRKVLKATKGMERDSLRKLWQESFENSSIHSRDRRSLTLRDCLIFVCKTGRKELAQVRETPFRHEEEVLEVMTEETSPGAPALSLDIITRRGDCPPFPGLKVSLPSSPGGLADLGPPQCMDSEPTQPAAASISLKSSC